MAEGEAALGRVELHRGDADVEDDAVDPLVAMGTRDRVEIGEAAFDQRQALAGGFFKGAAAAIASSGRGRWR